MAIDTATEPMLRPSVHFDVDAIDDHFPMEEYREGQKSAIEYAANAFNSGKKIVIIEAPTGSGKSPVAMTLADMVKDSYYLTITKILQDQLTGDFGEDSGYHDPIVELKGRNAYSCTFWDRYGQNYINKKLWSQSDLTNFKKDHGTCADGFCRTKWNQEPGKKKIRKHKCNKCFEAHKDSAAPPPRVIVPPGELDHLPPGYDYSTCPYYEQVFKAIYGRKCVMNFSSFLFQTSLTPRFNTPRNLMVIDECHNVEPILLDFVSLTINDMQLQDHGIFIPELETADAYALFFSDAKIEQTLIQIIKQAQVDEKNKVVDELSRTLKKYEMFMNHVTKTGAEWVCEYEEKADGKGGVAHRTVTLRPVYAMNFPEDLLFQYADKILMLSATVLDVGVMCRSLGIDRKDVAAFRMKNRFPAKNRPIYLDRVAKMTGGKAKMGGWMPKVVRRVDEIVAEYPNDKGIIHTHNFAIMDNILTKCHATTRARLCHQRSFRDKADMLIYHARTPGNVLIAPAMHEGIDLVGDLSRFQIICKVPYPNCFDNEQLARRVEIDRKYYEWLTALKLVQSYGRSIRSVDDYADTFILDEAIDRFLKVAKNMLPDWFLEAIQNK
jgi:Rad3-related DNA helicase